MAADLKVCDIDPSIKEAMKKFRFRKEKTSAAIVLKIESEKLLIVEDERHEDISPDELREELPSHQPRYVIYSYVYHHEDGRISYPLCFIYIHPSGCKPELSMKYSGSKLSLLKETGISKSFELRSTEELTEEWLKEKLKFFR